MNLAPIVLFVYNRPEHTKLTIEALKKNKLASESQLIIFADGPKNEEAEEKVSETREQLKTIQGFKTVEIIERDYNFGLAKSIIDGVTKVVTQYGKIIVLEDDLLTSPYFLKYMNEALTLYEYNDQVVSIHGYLFSLKETLPSTFFIRGTDCQGWATWKRGWDIFEPDSRKLLDELKKRKLTKEFDFGGAYPYTQMLEGQLCGVNKSWAVRWHAAAFLKNKLTLFPYKTLVDNIGFDGSGVHSGSVKIFENHISQEPIFVERIPLEENQLAREAIERYFKTPKMRIIIIIIWVRNYFKIMRAHIKLRW